MIIAGVSMAAPMLISPSALQANASATIDGGGLSADTQYTIEVKEPDGKLSSITVISDSGGSFSAEFTPTLAGEHGLSLLDATGETIANSTTIAL